ncbi:MAG: DUF6326 family protein [Pseudomonadota bacterium]
MLKTNELEWKLLLSGLWTYLLLNMLFRDVHEFFREGFLAQALRGIVNGNTVTEEALFFGGIALQIPLIMVVVPFLLPTLVNRWANAIAGSVILVGKLAFNTNPDMDDLLFALTGSLAILAILWLSWKGPRITLPTQIVCNGTTRNVKF